MRKKITFALLSLLLVPLAMMAQNVTIHPGNGSVLPCKKDGGGDSFFVYGGSSSWTHEQLPLTLVTGDSDNNLTNSGNQLTRSGQLANVANDIFVNGSNYITYESEGTTYYLNANGRFTTNKTTTWVVDGNGYVHSGNTYLVCSRNGNPRTLETGNSYSSRKLQKDNNGRIYYEYSSTTYYYLHGTTSANTAPTLTNNQDGLAEWTEETGDCLQIGKGNNMDTYVTIALPSGYRLTGYTITFKRVNQAGNKGLTNNSDNTSISFGETNNTFSDYVYGSGTYQNGINYSSSGNYSQYTISRTSQSDTDMGNVLYFKLSNSKQTGRAFVQLDYVELRFTAEYNYAPLTPGLPVTEQSAVEISFTTGKMDFGNLSEQEDGNEDNGYDTRISYNGRLHDLTGGLALYERESVKTITAAQNDFDGTAGAVVDTIVGSISSVGDYFKLDVSKHNHMKGDTAIYFIESPVWLVNGASSSQHKNPVGYRIVSASFDYARTADAPRSFKIQFHDYDDGWEGGSDYGLNYYSGQYNYNYQTIWSIDADGYIYYGVYYLSVVNDENVVIVTEKPTAADGTFEITNDNRIRRKNYTSQYIGWKKTTISGVTNRAAVITTSTSDNLATYNHVQNAFTENVNPFTFLIYDKTGTYVAKKVVVNSNSTTPLSIDSLNNDAVKIGVIGTGLIKGKLTLQALDPYIERLSIVCQENSGNSGGRVSQQFNAKDFSVKGGTFLFLVPSDFQGDAKFTFENLYSNYGDNTYWNETNNPERHSRYYFVGSTYGNYDNNNVYTRYNTIAHRNASYTTKVACSNPGNIKYTFNNAETVVDEGGYYQEYPFTLAKYQAKGGNFTTPFIFPNSSMNNSATKTAYLFTADETRYNIAPTTATQHVSYAYYEMTIKMDKIDYYPYLTWTKIYDETFYSADNSNIKRDSKWGLTLTTTENSQNTEMGTHSGYLTVSSILDYINGRATTGTVGQNGYIPLNSANAPATMDQILYIDASQLESIMETTDHSLSELKSGLDVNGLIYLPYGSQSQLENVASNMTAKYTDPRSYRSANNIVVTDRYPFYAPFDIQVDASKMAKYERTLTNSQLYGDDDQHLTIVLPFEINVDASGVHTNTDGQGSPFSLATMNRTNSLSKKTGSMINFYKDGADGYFTTISEKSEANKPYVVTMQDDAGESAFKVHQTGALVKATPNTTGVMTGEGPCTGTYKYKENDVEKTVNYSFTHKGTYTGIEIGGGKDGAAASDTTVFYFANNMFLDSKTLVNKKSLKMLPYRSYYDYTGTGVGAKMARFRIVFGENDEDDTTGISAVQKNSNLAVIPGDGYITIMAKADSNVAIHTVNGMAVEKCNLRAGETRTVAMPSGIYVINGVKMVVK